MALSSPELVRLMGPAVSQLLFAPPSSWDQHRGLPALDSPLLGHRDTDFTRSSFVADVLSSSSGAAAVMFAGLLIDVNKARTARRAPSGSGEFRRGLP